MEEIDITEVWAYYAIKLFFFIGGSNFVWAMLVFGLFLCWIARQK